MGPLVGGELGRVLGQRQVVRSGPSATASASAAASSAASRARLGLQGGDHVHVGGGVEGGRQPPGPLAQHAEGAPRPFHQPLDPPQGRGQVLLAPRGAASAAVAAAGRVQLAPAASASSAPRSASAASGGGRRPPAPDEVGQLGTGQVDPDRPQLGRHGGVGAGRLGLALEWTDLAAHLAHQVPQPFEVLLGGGQPAFGPLPAPAVLQDPRRLLDDGSPVFGTGVQHGVELALADDHVLLATDAGVAQQLLDVEQPAGCAVDGVLAVARAEQGPGDRHLGHVDRQLPRGVVDGERHLGPARAPVGWWCRRR